MIISSLKFTRENPKSPANSNSANLRFPFGISISVEITLRDFHLEVVLTFTRPCLKDVKKRRNFLPNSEKREVKGR